MSMMAFGGISKNADSTSYDFFYYDEPLLELVNDVRRLSAKNILFRPSDLKVVNISFGREQIELLSAFTEALDIYGFGFERMADNIYMIKRIRSVEDVAASLQKENSLVGGKESSSSAELLAEAYKDLATESDPEIVETESPPPTQAMAFKALQTHKPMGEIEGTDRSNRAQQVMNRLESPEFVKAVAGFQRRYIEALMTEGFTKEEAMKMALGFNPVSLVPSEEMPPTP